RNICWIDLRPGARLSPTTGGDTPAPQHLPPAEPDELLRKTRSVCWACRVDHACTWIHQHGGFGHENPTARPERSPSASRKKLEHQHHRSSAATLERPVSAAPAARRVERL